MEFAVGLWLKTIVQYSVRHVISDIILSLRIFPRLNTLFFAAMINPEIAKAVQISISLTHSLKAQMNQLSLKKV